MQLDLRSYVRVDTECTVPIEILKRTPEEGLQFELKSKSLQDVHGKVNGRLMQPGLVQFLPVVQTQTAMEEEEEEEEAQEEVGPSVDAAD